MHMQEMVKDIPEIFYGLYKEAQHKKKVILVVALMCSIYQYSVFQANITLV